MIPEKRAALTRRANKLIEWLHRSEYVDYVNGETTTKLIKVIDLIIWALERSIPESEWKPFERDFLATRRIIIDIFETDEAEKAAYEECLRMTVDTLRLYDRFIEQYNEPELNPNFTK